VTAKGPPIPRKEDEIADTIVAIREKPCARPAESHDIDGNAR
jgi:hypothetical protein